VLFDTDLSIRIGIFSALVVLVLVFSFAYWWFPAHRDTLTFVALAITAAGTLGGTFYLAETIRDQNRQQRNSYAFSLMARWNSPDLFHARRYWLTVTETFQKPGKDGGPEGVESLLSKTPTNEEERNAVHNIRHILNFIEEIAVAVKFEHASEEMLKLFFAGIVERAYEAFANWIPEHRKTTGRPLIWEQFYWLHSRWTKR
jgi:hypothetical protein